MGRPSLSRRPRGMVTWRRTRTTRFAPCERADAAHSHTGGGGGCWLKWQWTGTGGACRKGHLGGSATELGQLQRARVLGGEGCPRKAVAVSSLGVSSPAVCGVTDKGRQHHRWV